MNPSQFLRAVLTALWLNTVGIHLTISSQESHVIVSPTSVASDLGVADPTTPLVNMINQSGIETPFVSGTTDFDVYFANPGNKFATSGTGGTNNWQSTVSFTLPFQGTVDFDLGASYRLNKIAIWNRSLKDITVHVFEDLNQAGQLAGEYSLISRLSFPFSYVPDVRPFTGTFEGRYVRLGINSVHKFSASDTFGFAIVGEVVLSAVVAVVAAPSVSISLNSAGDVVVNFTGTLQFAGTVDGSFTDVSGNPQNTHTIPKGTLASEQFFRARSGN